MIAANSQATLNIFSGNFGVPRRGVVAYLGVDPIWFEQLDPPFENPHLAALPPTARIVCAVGRIEPRKGQLETVQAVAHARKLYGLGEAIFVVAGRAEDSSYAEEVVKEAGRLEIPLVATGRISDEELRRLYRRAACHTLIAKQLPGKVEGFGLTLLEAGAQGCPSVTTKVGGIPEVMGTTGAMVDPNDVDGIALAIAKYATNSVVRNRDGAASRNRALTFTWRACASTTFPELTQLNSNVQNCSPTELHG